MRKLSRKINQNTYTDQLQLRKRSTKYCNLPGSNNSVHILTEISYKSACQEQEAADHRCFGSIAQVGIATVDIAIFELHIPILCDRLAVVLVAIAFFITWFDEKVYVFAFLFSF